MDKTILHCDLNGFYASVELLYRPDLKDRPVAVCGDPEKRHGIILAKNETAKRCGVKTAETVWQAQRKCPDLVLLPPHHDWYEHFSQQVNAIYRRYTDLVEPFGIDESWLDVTGSLHLFGGSGRILADTIRETVKRELGLTVSVGVSFNKVIAKLGSDYRKPDATTVIDREHFQAIVHPLPVTALLYVGQVAADALARVGVHTIGQLAALDRQTAIALLGRTGETVHDYANGIDPSPVVGAARQHDAGKSVGSGMTFRRDLVGVDDIRAGIATLSDRVATQLRRQGSRCQTVQVVIKRPDLKVISRQKRLPEPSSSTRRIQELALEIVLSAWDVRQPIRMLTVTAMNLTPEGKDAPHQLSLFEDERAADSRRERLEETVDRLRDRFGRGAISFGGALANDLGLEPSSGEGEAAQPPALPKPPVEPLASRKSQPGSGNAGAAP